MYFFEEIPDSKQFVWVIRGGQNEADLSNFEQFTGAICFLHTMRKRKFDLKNKNRLS